MAGLKMEIPIHPIHPISLWKSLFTLFTLFTLKMPLFTQKPGDIKFDVPFCLWTVEQLSP